MSDPSRPAPAMGVYDAPMWDAFQQRELRLQHCGTCGHRWFPPGPACPACLSGTWTFEPVCGRGRIVAWTRFHKQYFESMSPPYIVVSVQLEEGPLVIGNLLGDEGEATPLDAAVRLEFEAVNLKGKPSLLPQWVLA
jgi:uncharacterized OB-fold protein